jgi:hypothetical protein
MNWGPLSPRRPALSRGDSKPEGRYDAGIMTAASVLIIVVALLCLGLVVIFGILWAALRFGVGEDDDD